MRRTIALPFLAFAALGACATGPMSDYPSLERRPIERQATVPPAPEVAPVPPPVSATLAEALRALAADADRGEAAFRAALAEAQSARSAAQGASIGSEEWAQSQLTLSRAEAARAPSTLALAELDRLLVVQGDEGNVAGLDAIAAEQSRVAALAAAQEQALAGLGGD